MCQQLQSGHLIPLPVTAFDISAGLPPTPLGGYRLPYADRDRLAPVGAPPSFAAAGAFLFRYSLVRS